MLRRIELVVVAAIACGSLQTAAAEYASAIQLGKARGPGCAGGFTDLKGQCWACPAGYRHDNVLLAPTHGKVCKKPGRTDLRKGTRVGKSKLGYCKKGWLSTNNGACYTCPKGYRHDHRKFGNQNGVCYRKRGHRYSAATRMQGSLVCDAGFFDPVNGGSCWRCPASAPRRTLASVKSNKACQALACGGEQSRPCLLTERVPSCDKGLREDFVKGRCVKAQHRVAICKATVSALLAGRKLAGVADLLQSTRSNTDRYRSQLSTPQQRREFLAQVASAIEPHKHLVPEMKRLMSQAKAKEKAIRALFTADNLCELPAREIDRRLAALDLKPSFMAVAQVSPLEWLVGGAHADDGHFFMGIQVGVGGGFGAGAHASLLLVTDFRGAAGSFVSVGPQAITNATIGAGVGLQFFPRATLESFIGGGLGVAVSGGPPTKAVGAGVDASFDGDLNFQGFGVSGSVGLGLIPGDLAIAGSHSWQL